MSGAGNWDVAVRSGGHSDFDNNAVHRGVTIDLSFFNSTELVASSCFNGTVPWAGQSMLTKVNLSQLSTRLFDRLNH